VIEKAFRLDFLIAIAALLVSTVSAIALLYQTHVIGAEYAATIWPYLTVDENYNDRQQQVVLANDGMGPALIHSARLELNGHPVAAWTDYWNRLKTEIKGTGRLRGQSVAFSAQGVGAGSTLRPGASLTLFSASFSRGISGRALNLIFGQRLLLRFCYCSLNGSCWIMTASSTGPISTQVPVHACGSPSIITASTSVLASPMP
jgi:hypothetical protein